MWDVKKWFPDLPVINRGFGGSQIADSVEFADRIVLPCRPKVIVFYAGDNDTAAGKTPEQITGDFKMLVQKVHKALPKTRIVVLAIKPSAKRWQFIERVRETNPSHSPQTEKDPRLVFVDVEPPMLADGKPRAELFLADGLHLNAEGYAPWTSLSARTWRSELYYARRKGLDHGGTEDTERRGRRGTTKDTDSGWSLFFCHFPLSTFTFPSTHNSPRLRLFITFRVFRGPSPPSSLRVLRASVVILFLVSVVVLEPKTFRTYFFIRSKKPAVCSGSLAAAEGRSAAAGRRLIGVVVGMCVTRNRGQ